MELRILVTMATLCVGLALGSAPAARAADAEAPFEHPLSTDWLGAAPALPEPSAAPVCRADQPGTRRAAALTGARLAEARARLAEVARAAQASGQVTVLNNRGYNYDARAAVDPALVQLEASHLAR